MPHFKDKLHNDLDKALESAVNVAGGIPGVVAMLTDKQANIYEGALGKLSLDCDEKINTESVFNAFSTTKALVGALLFTLIEENIVKLDDLAKEYLPEIADIEVLEGFDKDSKPITRKAKNDITLRHLVLHTAGFGYEFFNKEDLAYRQYYSIPSVVTNTLESLQSVLLFEPGTSWNYGINIDWLGLVLEKATSKRLSVLLKEKILEPCNMRDTVFDLTDSLKQRLAIIHVRDQSGKLSPARDITLPNPSPIDMGGHGLHCTVTDYMKFIRMILNDGVGENGRVLSPQSINFMCMNGIGTLRCQGWDSAIPLFTNKGEFYPSIQKSWGYTFQINEEMTNTGRPAHTIMWAGISNLFYFIDRKNGIGGFWASEVLPFMDPSSYGGFLQFESSIYQNLLDKKV